MKRLVGMVCLFLPCASVADLSGWSDKTVCRLVKQKGTAEYIDEAKIRNLDCVSEIIDIQSVASEDEKERISSVARSIPYTHFQPHEDIANLYHGYERYINKEFDFPSLRISTKDFVTGQFVGDSKTDRKVYYLRTMVQLADYGDLDGDGDNDLAMGGWASENRPARLHYLYFENGVPVTTEQTVVEATAAPWVRDFNNDGTAEVLTVGFYDSPTAPANSYYFPNGLASKLKVGPMIDSHESDVVDFDGDGDLDVIAITYGGVKRKVSLFKNTSGKFTHEYLNLTGNPEMIGSSIVADDFNGNGKIEFIIGDSGYPKYDKEIWKFDLNASHNKSFKAAPKQKMKGYFSDKKYQNLVTSFDSSKNPNDHSLNRSHDIFLGSADIDNDGDKDLVVGTVLWNQQTPFGVAQIFINDGHGHFSDDTDIRLKNFQLSGDSAHTMTLKDINGDGAVDIIMSDRNSWIDWVGVPLDKKLAYDLDRITSGNRILINDGSGHFVSVHEGIFADFTALRGWSNSWFPVINSDNTITFVSLFRTEDGEKDLWQYAKLKAPLSTGPNFSDPALKGQPGFNEFFVLRTSLEARNAVLSGAYESALDWYISTNPGIPINAQ